MMTLCLSARVTTFDFDRIDWSGLLAIHNAATTNDLQYARLIISSQPTVDIEDNDGYTALV